MVNKLITINEYCSIKKGLQTIYGIEAARRKGLVLHMNILILHIYPKYGIDSIDCYDCKGSHHTRKSKSKSDLLSSV